MSLHPREEAVCPYCQVSPPFTITVGGMKITHSRYSGHDSKIRMRASRRPWELEMLDHLYVKHRAQWVLITEAVRTGRPAPVPLATIREYPADNLFRDES